MKPIFFVLLGGALLVSVAKPQFGHAQTTPVNPFNTRPKNIQLPPPPPTSPSRPTLITSTANSVLPLNNVVLFSSGVGYFGRSGQVDGDASVDLLVRAPQLSDILKSLVLFDPKGRVDPVTYSIQDYIAARPTTTDLNIDPNSSPGAILRLLQGAVVRIERQSGTIEGRVVSVSTQQIKDGDTLRTVEFATLLTATGLTTVRLDDVLSFTPLDRGLADKFAASLEKRGNNLTRGLDNGVRPVTLHFRGKGRRDVRAGYLLESPAWKTSYRLVLEPKQKPYLQGWAIVENPGDEDWRDVNLSLVSGRPISFIQDLATPVYIVRPIVQPQIIGSPRPQTFGPGYGGQNELVPTDQIRSGGFGGGGFGGGGFSGAPAPSAAPVARAARESGSYAMPALRDADEAIRAQTKVDAQASGGGRGNLFVYAIDTKVSIPHGQAAMVPIVSENVDGEAVTIVQSDNEIGALDAQNGFCLRNRGGLNLQGGPIAVYSDGIYGGDAQISNVSPGEARLISYAVDLDLIGRLESSEEAEEITAIRPTEGALQVTKRATRVQIYGFKNKSNAPKVVFLQQPNEDEWKLVDAKQLLEKSNDGLRFRIEVPAQKTVGYTIKWQKPQVEIVALRDLNPDQIGFYTVQTKLSPELKAKLLAIIALKKRANDIAGQRAAQEKSLASITSDQTRIRENLKALNQNSPLYKTYEAKLMAQETQVDKVQGEIDRLRDAENAARQAVNDAIAKLGEEK